MLAQGFDVVIVGARCAGSPLATMLARQGVNVAVLERATFPRDTLSTHIFEADGLAFLDRLGVTDQLHATGAPFMMRSNSRAEDFRFNVEWPQRAGDVGGSASVRRTLLDPILVESRANRNEAAREMIKKATPIGDKIGKELDDVLAHNLGLSKNATEQALSASDGCLS